MYRRAALPTVAALWRSDAVKKPPLSWCMAARLRLGSGDGAGSSLHGERSSRQTCQVGLWQPSTITFLKRSHWFRLLPHKLVDSTGRKGAPVWVRKLEEERHLHYWHLLLEFRTIFLYWVNLTHLFIFDLGEISIFYEYLQEKSHHLSWKYWSLTDFSFCL